MVNVDCAGGQDRATTTSETHPYRPPSQTLNCYTDEDGPAPFDSSLCGTSDDRACQGRGGVTACKPDNQGGYCEVDGGDEDDDYDYYISQGSTFKKLSESELLERYRDVGDTGETGREVRRALNDQERRFTNRIRELQIMGENPLIQRGNNKNENNEGNKDNEDNEVHSFVGDLLFNIGMGISFFMFIASLCIILIQKNII